MAGILRIDPNASDRGVPQTCVEMLPLDARSDDRAVQYLRCLLAITRACNGDDDAPQVARSVTGLLVGQCAGVSMAAAYRVADAGRRAVLLAHSGAEGDVEGIVELPLPFEWPAPEAGPHGGAAQAPTVVAVLAPSPDARPLGWLTLRGAEPHSPAWAVFVESAAQTLAIALARIAARDRLRLDAQAVARREEAISTFLGEIGNEIRTSLTLLLGPLEAGAQRHGDAALTMALRHGQRLRWLAEALGDLAGIDAGRVDPVLVPVDIAALTRDIASQFHGAAVMAGIALTVDCPSLPQPVHVDRAQWEEVVINLIGNAIRCTSTGQVRVSLRAQGGLMTLDVSDTGRGIEPGHLPGIVDRFQRNGDLEGPGRLGLARVRDLVALHGGHTEAHSVPGEGTRVRVCLPMSGRATQALPHRHLTDVPTRIGGARTADATPVRAAPVDVDVEAAAIPGMRERIVVAIDHRELREYVAGLLQPHFRVQALSCGADALQAVEQRAPDLVLVDLVERPLDAAEFLGRLRASPHGAAVPALLLSSDAREFAQAGAIEAGADDVVDKPFIAAELLARVAAHMRLSSQRRALHRGLKDHARELEEQVAARTAALSASEAQFRTISDLVPDILWRTDAQGRVEWRNAQWSRFTGDDGSTPDIDFVHPEDRQRTLAWFRETVAGRTALAHEYRLRRHDGAYTWFIARMSPLTGPGGRIERWFGSATDIERNQLARRALEVQVDAGTVALAHAATLHEQLLHRLSRSQEDERRRIARELHDSLGQYLTALKLALGSLAPAIADPRLRQRVEHLDAITTEVDRELDHIIAALRPVVLDELGLAGALPGIVADWSRHSGIPAEVVLVHVEQERFDDETESTLYRATQEGLTNVVKHARARRVDVTLTRIQDTLCLTVEDDGVGFDVADIHRGWGLRGMAERARSVGGMLDVESTPGAGTTVIVRLPCRPQGAAAPSAA